MKCKFILLSRQRRVSLPALWHGLWLTIFSFLLFTCSSAQTWSDVGGGVNQPGGGTVFSMDVFSNELYVGGAFITAGGVEALRIARWNGTEWDSVRGGSTLGIPYVFGIYDNELYAAGSFDEMDGVPNTMNIARWNGLQWLSAGSNINDNADLIYALVEYKNELYAGGNITKIGGVNINRIARWDGNSWKNVGGGVTGGFIPEVRAMAVFNNELYVGGDFTFAGGVPANYIARWNGTQWDSVGSGLNYVPVAMVIDTINNILYVGGGIY